MSDEGPLWGLELLVETTDIDQEFTGYMIVLSGIVRKTMDVLGNVMSGTLIFGREMGPFHTRFVVDGSMMGASMIAVSQFSR